MKNIIKNSINSIWNFEFKDLKPNSTQYVFGLIIVVGSLYVLGEVIFGFSEIGYSISKFFESTNNAIQPKSGYKKFQYLFPYIWLSLAIGCVLIRFTIIISSYFKSKKVLGNTAFNEYLLTYFVSFVISISTGILFLYLVAGILMLLGIKLNYGIDVFYNILEYIKVVVNNNIPSILQVQNYWLALVLTIIFSGLPGYFIHWLTHKYRIFWLFLHRSHHSPQFLHPMGSPPGFSFTFFLTIPGGLVSIIVSKIIYTEPMVMEMILWNTMAYWLEIFNHSIVHYKLANSFPIRNLGSLFNGNGVYHLMHHSAKETDQMINLGGGPFLIWDRVFGTYKKPYEEAPPIGLTKLPKMKLNPFRIIFSGIAQMLYELKMNKDWLTRLKIILGGIYYVPPITRDFLVISYENNKH